VTERTVYVDASAMAKLLVDEREGDDLRAFLAPFSRQATSIVGRVEVERTVARRAPALLEHVAGLLDDLVIVGLELGIAAAAATIRPAMLRTLDAIHLASAAALGADLAAFVTYDRRLAEAARALGLPVASPGAST
jgi:predicted nucleic acid-binding protein